ncbi:MAG: hypothetical protein Q9225_003962 [Loekoesia sp. 1 TL-2023]
MSTRNPFAPLQNNSRSNPSGQGISNKGPKSADYPYHLDKEIISKDLTNDRPLYILSAYGPGRDAPQQLFGGQPREQSFEELRLRHYEFASAGNQSQAIQEAQTLYNNAEQQIQKVLSDPDGALRYITDAANQHPNRLDVCKAKGGDPSQLQQPPGIFQSGGGPPTSAPTFGQSSFGQPSAPTFGKPSFGQAAAPAPTFGQPASIGQKPTIFGQSSTPNQAPAFGQTSVPTPFVQPQAVVPLGAQQSQQPPAFGQTSTSSPFDQPQQATKPLGAQQSQQQPAFGQQNNFLGKQPSTGPQASGIFGQQQTPAPSNPFAKAPTTTSAFGQAATAPTNPFSKPEAPQTTNAFGKISAPQPAVNPFGSKNSPKSLDTSGQGKPTFAPTFGQPAAPSSTGTFAKPAERPSIQAPTAAPTAPTNAKFETDKEGNRKLLSWQGKRVTYVGDDPCIKNSSDGGWQRIWFPEGAPTFTSKTQEYPDGYVPDGAARENFKHFFQHGVGLDGLIPDMPPPRDMISWNF